METSQRITALSGGYPELRNFGYVRQGVEWITTADRLQPLHSAWHRMSGRSYSKLLHSICWPANTTNPVHTFNKIPLSHQPFIVTFESELPRSDRFPGFVRRYLQDRLASRDCIAVVALSNCAADRLSASLVDASDSMRDAILDKLIVLHPPQSILVDWQAKQSQIDWNGELRLSLIGHDFYRKGGLELLEAINILVARGISIRLDVAGKLVAGDYASRAGVKEENRARQLMASLGDHVVHRGEASADAVGEMLAGSHLVCLPTWADSYGYSVLEGQASGCAALTTDVRALPEINDATSGWVIPVAKTTGGDADIDSHTKRQAFQRELIRALVDALAEAHWNRADLVSRARGALKRIAKQHSPEHHAANLCALYERAITAQ